MPETRRVPLAGLVPVRADEWSLFGLAFLYFFLLLCGYYLLRPLRDALVATTGLDGMKWLFTATSAVMLLLAPAYGLLVARLRKNLLLPAVYLFFASNLLVFHELFRSGLWPGWTAQLFFVWLSVFNMFVVSVFWSLMADLLSAEQALRLFGPIAAGGSAGAILGPILAHELVGTVGAAGLVLLAAACVGATALCIAGLRHQAARRGAMAAAVAPGHRVGGSAWAGIAALGRSRFLLAICALMLLGSMAATFMYLEIVQQAGRQLLDAAERTRFFARLDLAVNTGALLVQFLLTPWLVRRFGIAAGLLLLPLLALGSFVWVALAPTLMTLAWTQVLRRILEFGAARPSREMLFTAVDEEARFKAKNFIDTAVQRAGDTLSAWLHALLHAAGLAAGGLGIACAGAMLAMMGLAAWVAREFERCERGLTGPPVRGPVAALHSAATSGASGFRKVRRP